jgi:TRAP-type C4-dicarboxylate transport system substrate-binding protein
MKKKISMLFVAILVFVVAIAGCGNSSNTSSGSNDTGSKTDNGENKASSGEVVEWNFSIWGGPRAWTFAVEEWAKAMEERTDGRWVIKLHYGETLGPAKEQLDGLSNGLFEAAAIAPFYTPGKLPLQQVMDLPFIAPLDYKELSALLIEVQNHPAVVEEMDSWNIVPLLPVLPPQYEYMGKEKIEKAEDFNGVKIAGMSADQGRVFEMFGAVPTPMPAPELYSSLERGTINGLIFPYSYAFGAYNLHEVSKYNTVGIGAGSPISAYYANKQEWEALPEEFREIHNKYVEEEIIDIAAGIYADADEKWIKEFEESGIEIIELPTEERQKFLDKAGIVWDGWVDEWEDRGPTQEILDFTIEKRKEISGY